MYRKKLNVNVLISWKSLFLIERFKIKIKYLVQLLYANIYIKALFPTS